MDEPAVAAEIRSGQQQQYPWEKLWRIREVEDATESIGRQDGPVKSFKVKAGLFEYNAMVTVINNKFVCIEGIWFENF